ncbi:MAG: AAA family ATPase [Bacteroidetes bacterium]|nr:AAA family ATPase [Bacteroidota bacterium]
MELRSLSVKRYKSYRGDTSVEIAPLTILVGANNSGKTALAQAFHLLASSLAPSGDDIREPLLMSSGGVRHGRTFVDLVNRHSVHGRLSLSAVLVHEGSESSLSVTVQNVLRPSKPSERQILKWSFSSGSDRIEARRKVLDQQSPYEVSVSGGETSRHQINWLGLLPRKPHQLPDWVDAQAEEIRKWANGVRYLECPRSFSSSRFTIEEPISSVHEAKGAAAPIILVADDDLRGSVREWYHKAFEVSLNVRTEGRYFDLIVGSPAHGSDVLLGQSGGGLSQVLPVVVTALTAKQAGPGVDIIEHPEAELHPAAHAHVAELLLSNLSGSARPMIIETHSEMILLRARRWIAEGRLPHDHVAVYWINTEPEHGSVLQKITINDCGEMSSWPDGVFSEDYEEVLAIRRASVRNMGR